MKTQNARLYFQPIVLLVLLVWPWLNPFVPGPSTLAVSILTGWIGVVGVFLFWHLLSHRVIATGWLLAGLISTAIALCQILGISDAFGPWMNQTTPGNIFANLRQRNQFASLTNIALVALLWFVVQGNSQGVALGAHENADASVKYKKFWPLAAVFLGIGNALSSSRTGLIQLVVLSGLLFLWPQWRTPQIKRLMGLVWLAYAFGSFVLPVLTGSSLWSQGIFSRFATESLACASRRILWANVLELIAQKPWLGWGWGELDYAHFITLFSGPRFCEIVDNAHNLPLHLAVELGVPAALLICGVGLAWAVRRKPWRETQPGRQLAWAVLLVIGLHSLLEYPLWYGPFQLAVLLCLCLLWDNKLIQPATETEQHRLVRTAFALVMLGAWGFVMWEYQRVNQVYLPPHARMPAYQTDTFYKLKDIQVFNGHLQFAALTLSPVTPSNAALLNSWAHQLLHFSPEVRVVTKLIESAIVLGKNEEVAFYKLRFEAAYPEAYQQWLSTHSKAPAPIEPLTSRQSTVR